MDSASEAVAEPRVDSPSETKTEPPDNQPPKENGTNDEYEYRDAEYEYEASPKPEQTVAVERRI